MCSCVARWPRILSTSTRRIWSFCENNKKTIKRFCIGNLNYFQMHLCFFIAFKIIHTYANSFGAYRVWPWHRASFVPHIVDFIFLTLKLTIFNLFKLTLAQTVYRLCMPLGFSGFIFHGNDTLHSFVERSLRKFEL